LTDFGVTATVAPGDGMEPADSRNELARKTLAAVRARLTLVAAHHPAEMTSPSTIRETLAFVRMLHRYGFDVFEDD